MNEKPDTAIPPETVRGPALSSKEEKISGGVPIDVADSTWEQVVERAGKPVVVMYHSPACSFCHQMEPAFRNFAGEYNDTVLFARLNILSSQWTAERYGVRGTPTFQVFCKGKPVRELVGAVYPALLKKMIDDVLLHEKECADKPMIDYEITGYG